MSEIIGICLLALIMACIYAHTTHPKLYAFFNTMAGMVSLIFSEIYFSGTAADITPYSASLSVILGVPGTALHYFLGML